MRAASSAGLGGALSSCSSALSPLTVNGPIKRDVGRPQIVVDAHCHVFNGKDVDIGSYATAMVRDELPPPLARLFEGYVKIFAAVLRAEAPPLIKDEYHTGEIQLIQELNAEINRCGLQRGSDRCRGRMESLIPHIFGARDIHERQAITQTLEWMINPVNLFRRSRKLTNSIEKALYANKDTEAAHNYFTKATTPEAVRKALSRIQKEGPLFFVHFINYRTVNAYEMWRQFNPRDGAINIDLFTPASIDYDAWFNADNTELDEDSGPQCILSNGEPNRQFMEQLAILFNGEMLPIISFCPRRAAEATEQVPGQFAYRCEKIPPLKVVQQAITTGGHIGVKIYPPMGFRATRNAELDSFGNGCFEGVYKKYFPQGLGIAMDRELDKLYGYCETSRVPIMTHAVESHGSHPGYAKRSSPEFWLPLFDEALAKRCGLSRAYPNIQLSFAHLGGWHPSAHSALGRLFEHRSHIEWPEQIVRLMRSKPHVFSDIGDIAEIGERGWGEAFSKALHAWHDETPKDSPHRPCEKLIYGSDWFVMANADIFRQRLNSSVPEDRLVGPSYLQRWADKLSKDFPEHYRDIMGHNALRFFGLDKGPALARVDGFLNRHELTPRWRKKLKAALA